MCRADHGFVGAAFSCLLIAARRSASVRTG